MTIQRQRLLDEFLELVQVDSETGRERRICDVLKNKFARLGIAAEEDDTAAVTGHGAGNLFAWVPAASGYEKAPAVLFTVHMDTVKPGSGVRPRLDGDGYVRSDGTTILGSDDKAGIAAVLEAVRTLKERKLPHGPLQIIITAGEESGLVGSRAIDPRRIKAEFGYALDAEGKVGGIVTAAPAQEKIEVRVYGKSAHAGVNPEDGISAIQVASAAISRMRLGRIDSETTANIGSFHGGEATNIVCDMAVIRAEARSLTESKLERQVRHMREAFESAAEAYRTRVDFTSERIYPAFRFDGSEPVVQTAVRALQSIGRFPRLVRSGGGSDANNFNGMGVPTVNLAIGYEHIHTTKEQLPLEELVKTAEAVVAIAREAAVAGGAERA